jgi:hypothetical protein
MREDPFCAGLVGGQDQERDADGSGCKNVDRCEPEDDFVKGFRCQGANYSKYYEDGYG